MDAGQRARLVEDHLDLARRAAALVHGRVGAHVELDELVSLANAGLAEAAARFEPDRGVTFATFAWYRIQGTMMDAMRKSTTLPRRVWTRLVALRAASEYLEHLGEREVGARAQGAAPKSGADALGAVKDALAAIRTMYVTSLDALQDEGFDQPEEAAPMEQRIDAGRLGRRLRKALAQLPEKERALMTKHYYEGKNLLEAGAELGISKSWASRLHAQAVAKLRAVVDAEA